jgi:hypothetical protein
MNHHDLTEHVIFWHIWTIVVSIMPRLNVLAACI